MIKKVFLDSKSVKVVFFSSALLTVMYSAGALVISEDFRKETTQNAWWTPGPNGLIELTNKNNINNSACLTAGKSTALPSLSKAGSIRGCGGIDKPGFGALRLTTTKNSQVGSIVSNVTFPTNDGIDIIFTTYTYGGTGADGMTFILMDGAAPINVGQNGGALGYGCIRGTNWGILGGYIGIGIDEYGNFLNRGHVATAADPKGVNGTSNGKNAITVRGAGSTNEWYYREPDYFLTDFWKKMQWGNEVPFAIKQKWRDYKNNTFFTKKGGAIYQNPSFTGICQNGSLTVPSDYTPQGVGEITWSWNETKDMRKKFYNYPVLAYQKSVNSSGQALPLYSKAGKRSDAFPITYKIKLSPKKILNVWYSYNGGAYTRLLDNYDIVANNGPLPSNFRFAFAASTGGSTNNHEVLCFKAAPPDNFEGTASNNADDRNVQAEAFIYKKSFNDLYWTGSITATKVSLDKTDNSAVVSTAPSWDGSCELTGGKCSSTGTTVEAQPNSSRNFFSWNGNSGISLNWSDLNDLQKSYFKSPGETEQIGKNRLAYIKGDRSREDMNTDVSTQGSFRYRTNLLSDPYNSSPTWVGPPEPLVNKKLSSDNDIEIAKAYNEYISQNNNRANIVYVGANDGFLHGFRSGSYVNDKYVPSGTDGQEVMAYMPLSVMSRIHQGTGRESLDFSNSLYSHNFYVDATPGKGDIYYGNKWHTWILGGLGAGGASIYALDVTNTDFSTLSAADLVKGEWSYAANSIWKNLGNTYGTPQFVRFNNGKWGAVFGNGWCSRTDADNGNCTASAGEAGIYIMVVDDKTGEPSFSYISTNKSGESVDKPNGIAEVTPFDLDGDGKIDYVYAGDLQGNVWRFNLTATDGKWDILPDLVFTTLKEEDKAQPITTKIVVQKNKSGKVSLNFGTGKKQIGYLTASDSYANSTQSFYGLWDKNVSTKPTGPISNIKAQITRNQLGVQTITEKNGVRLISTNAIDLSTKLGFYVDFINKNNSDDKKDAKKADYEQLIWNPAIDPVNNDIDFNTFMNGVTARVSCDPGSITPQSYRIDPLTGKSVIKDEVLLASVSGVGSPTYIKIGGVNYLVTIDVNGNIILTAIKSRRSTYVKRLSWQQIFD